MFVSVFYGGAGEGIENSFSPVIDVSFFLFYNKE